MELEEQNQWRFQHEVYDPLLLTDVSLQQQQSSNSPSKSECKPPFFRTNLRNSRFFLIWASDFLIKISTLADISPPSPRCLNDSVMVDPGYPFDDGDANEGSDKNFASFFYFTSFLVSE